MEDDKKRHRDSKKEKKEKKEKKDKKTKKSKKDKKEKKHKKDRRDDDAPQMMWVEKVPVHLVKESTSEVEAKPIETSSDQTSASKPEMREPRRSEPKFDRSMLLRPPQTESRRDQIQIEPRKDEAPVERKEDRLKREMERMKQAQQQRSAPPSNESSTQEQPPRPDSSRSSADSTQSQERPSRSDSDRSSNRTRSSDTPSVPSKPTPKPSQMFPVASVGSQGPVVSKNLIAAQMMRAKLAGDTATYERLQKELDGTSKQPQVISVLDDRGRPIIASTMEDRGVKVTKHGKFEEYGKDGQRERYFRDDDNITLDEMVAKEKLGKNDYDEKFARNIAKNSSYKQPGEDDFDDMTLQQWGKSNQKKKREKQDRNQRQRTIQEHHRQDRNLKQCWFCFDNPNLDKSLLISLGEYTYLALPKRGAFNDGHVLIVPMGHIISCTSVDENVENEINMFKKSLQKMFAKQKQDVIFLEIVTDFKRQTHTFIECIPVPLSVGDQAPMYFKLNSS
eukprot:TRINITY_DN1456_c0_g2_i3.p1 TRINITY_DN1456_c0_g2~~TRINITY_DN1456_c0_g2_i3.p1  ORF type:complete len:505 (+),score=185.81 TRINITY_DN1456_c0_g2_i3:232-1746(+)